ncbi:hypothetical protein [Desulfosarcina sp.]|uniref:hypothetical protein n=1 Tax=Desulfosarcina sp. TaxID=2027861 RepID=UPI0039710190
MSIELKVGLVFRWNNFPDNRYGDGDKARWFICVGFTGAFSQIALVHSYTTTTQLHHFESGGFRRGHSHFIFKCAEHICFEQDCAIDFDESPYSISIVKIAQFGPDIEEKGTLREETMRMIYKRTIGSRQISLMVKKDIYNSYNLAGITGLKKPKRS